MHNNVAKIHQHPFARILAFRADDFATGFLDLLIHIARQRLDLTVRIAAGNDDAQEQRRQLGGIENLDVLALDFLERGDDDSLQLPNVHGMSGK